MAITDFYDEENKKYDNNVDLLVIDIFLPLIIQLRMILNDDEIKKNVINKMKYNNNENIKEQLIEILKKYLNFNNE